MYPRNSRLPWTSAERENNFFSPSLHLLFIPFQAYPSICVDQNFHEWRIVAKRKTVHFKSQGKREECADGRLKRAVSRLTRMSTCVCQQKNAPLFAANTLYPSVHLPHLTWAGDEADVLFPGLLALKGKNLWRRNDEYFNAQPTTWSVKKEIRISFFTDGFHNVATIEIIFLVFLFFVKQKTVGLVLDSRQPPTSEGLIQLNEPEWEVNFQGTQLQLDFKTWTV